MFSLENIEYRGILNIKDASFRGGEVTFIRGESGAGKSTLLKLLNRMISPDKGRVLLQGDDISALDPLALRRRAAMLPQSPVIFEGDMEFNLSAGAIFGGLPLPDTQRVTRISRLMGLEIKPGLNPEKLSGGEAQRLSLARIILADPEIFLLDEPSSSLDKKSERRVMENFLGYIKDHKKTAIIVSHSEDIAADLAQNTLSLKEGAILS